MTLNEQRGLLHAIRASLRSALGGLEHYIQRLEGAPDGDAWGDAQEDGDGGEGPSDLTTIAAALSEATRVLRPPPQPAFPLDPEVLRRLLARYGPTGEGEPGGREGSTR